MSRQEFRDCSFMFGKKILWNIALKISEQQFYYKS